MNRQRKLIGANSYEKDIGLNIIKLLFEKSKTEQPVLWAGLCCGEGNAIIEASKIFQKKKNQDFLFYKNENFPLPIMQDSTFYGFNGKNSEGLYVSSVRTYRSDDLELAIPHLATGHEIGWMSSDPKIIARKKAEGETAILAKEHKPDFEFSAIETAIYKEPLLHHGYGLGVFIIIK